MAYFSMPLDEESCKNLVALFHFDTFECLVLPQGKILATYIFQSRMRAVISGMQDKAPIPCLDVFHTKKKQDNIVNNILMQCLIFSITLECK